MSYADVFISYKSEEEATARHVREVLEANGISCWMAPDSIPTGSNYMKQIPQAIDHCKAMVVLISEKSMQSTWVKNEFSEAISKDKLIIPYVIQDCKLEDEFAFSMSTMQQVFAWKNEQQALEKIVRDIRDAIGQNPNANIEINIVNKSEKDKKKTMILAGAAVAAVLLIAVIVLLLNRNGSASTSTAAATGAQVYYSEVVPYYLTGMYQSAEAAQNDTYEPPFFSRAISLLSFIRNDTDKSMFVEKIACDIENVTPLMEPELQTDGVLEDGRLSLFVFNNGWGDAEKVETSWYPQREYDVPAFPALEEQLTGSGSVVLEAGSAAAIMQAEPDFSELLAWARSQNMKYASTLYTMIGEAKYENQDSLVAMFLMYDPEQDAIIATYGGADDDRPMITLYNVLDVDNPPKELRFYAPESSPLVEDTFRIETVIIPTKSCEVTLNGAYSIGGTDYQTEKYTVRVQVPYFDENAFTVGGPLTRQLSRINPNDTAQIKRICGQYRYEIQSILPDDVPRG